MKLNAIIFLFSCLALAACKKEVTQNDCNNLQKAMQLNSADDAKTAMTQIINKLPSKKHTKENMERLTASISGNCSISAELLCFACIQTLPEQSEIQLTFITGGNVVKKTIDLSYDTDNNIKFVNMHD